MRPPGRRRGAIDASLPLNEAALRFAGELAALWPLGQPLGIAVSGGADSLALLLLAHQARPDGIAVATVDHQLRPESGSEAAMVAKVCAERGLAHRILTVSVASAGNAEAQARAARYRALASWAGERGLAVVATAHHLDDQAETMLMRLTRGAGVRGLAGMRARSPLPGAPDIALLRPLLGWRRSELAAVVAAAGLSPVHDPSNDDLRFERARLRRALSRSPWLPPEKLAASARNLADADEALAWAAQREWAEQVDATEGRWLYRPLGPRAIRLRVLERLLALAGSGTQPRGHELARMLDRLEAGETTTLAGAKAVPGPGGAWHIAPAPPHRRGPPKRSPPS